MQTEVHKTTSPLAGSVAAQPDRSSSLASSHPSRVGEHAHRRAAGGVDAGTGWRVALPALVLALAWVVAWYLGTAVEMVSTWARSETYAHGFVVVPIALWLVWMRRREVAAIAPVPAFWPLIAIALAGTAWLAGALTVTNALMQFGFVAMLVLAIPAIAGTRVARCLLFPLGYLFFAIPVGEFLLPTLMSWTADFTIAALRLSGVPVFREGQHFQIPTGRWSVVEACSGVRYLIASLVIGTLFAYLTYRSTARRLAFVAVAVAVPVVANWIRAYLIVMLGHLSNNTIAVGVDHLIYGWLFFGFVMLLMFWIGARWRETASDVSPSTRAAVPGPVSATAPGRSFWFVAPLLAVITVAPALLQTRLDSGAATSEARLPPLPQFGAWREVGEASAFVKPHFTGASTEHWTRYESPAGTVALYIGYYRDQDSGRKLLASENVLLPVESQRAVMVDQRDVDVAAGEGSIAARASNMNAQGTRVIAWQWYWVDGTLTANPFRAKAATAWSQLRGRGDDSAVIVVETDDRPAHAGSARLAAFVRDAWPAIDRALADTHGGASAGGRASAR